MRKNKNLKNVQKKKKVVTGVFSLSAAKDHGDSTLITNLYNNEEVPACWQRAGPDVGVARHGRGL